MVPSPGSPSLFTPQVNIELPVTLAKEKHAKLAPVLVNKLLEDYNISAPCFPYGERVYVRVAGEYRIRFFGAFAHTCYPRAGRKTGQIATLR
jgi:hypothetical protein